MDSWLAGAKSLVGQLGLLKEYSQSLDGISTSDLDIEPEKLSWLKARLSKLVEEVSDLERSNQQGSILDIETRRAMIDEIEQATLEAASDDWEYAIREIAESPVYGELQLKPIVGLIPLGVNKNGLWEFGFYESGDLPEWDDEREGATVGENSGMVFVLIPGSADVNVFLISKYEMTRVAMETDFRQ